MTAIKTLFAAAALVGASTLAVGAQPLNQNSAGQYEFLTDEANRGSLQALIEGRNSADVGTPHVASDAYAEQYEFLANEGRHFDVRGMIEGRNSAVVPQPQQQNDLTDRSGR